LTRRTSSLLSEVEFYLPHLFVKVGKAGKKGRKAGKKGGKAGAGKKGWVL
jgi:hypothetical protein